MAQLFWAASRNQVDRNRSRCERIGWICELSGRTRGLESSRRPTSQNARQNGLFKELLGTAGLVIFRSGDLKHMRTGSDVGQISIARTSARDVI
jgi:hypothetical protein